MNSANRKAELNSAGYGLVICAAGIQALQMPNQSIRVGLARGMATDADELALQMPDQSIRIGFAPGMATDADELESLCTHHMRHPHTANANNY